MLRNNLKINGGLFSYMYIYKEIFMDKDYYFNINLNNSTILDIGTNIGMYSLWLNEKFKNINVHCFEPIPKLYNAAKININKMKHNKNNFYLNNIGLSNKKETKDITYFPNASGLSTTCQDFEDKKKAIGGSALKRMVVNLVTKNKEQLNIKLDTIKNYIIKNKLNEIELCKIDVECSELMIMEGFQEYINNVKYYIIEIENYRSDYLKKIKKILINYDIQIDNPKKNWIILFAKRKPM
jgi:FkbM family methyltransferase